MMRTRVFVSGPLTQGDQEANALRAIRAGQQLIAAGFAPHVPHFWHFAPNAYETAHDVWLEVDLAQLPGCAAMVRLDGPSRGADIEEAEAHRLGIPVYRSVDECIAAFSGNP